MNEEVVGFSRFTWRDGRILRYRHGRRVRGGEVVLSHAYGGSRDELDDTGMKGPDL